MSIVKVGMSMFMLAILFGCTSPPKAPEPKGELSPVNPPSIIYEDLAI